MTPLLEELNRIAQPLIVGAEGYARLRILSDIATERERQATKFPADEHELDLFVGLAVLGEEKGECDRAALEARTALIEGRYDEQIHDRALRTELLHTAAVAVKLIEILDRNALAIGYNAPEPSALCHSPALDEHGNDVSAALRSPIPEARAVLWCGECRTPLDTDSLGPVCPYCGARPEDIIGDPWPAGGQLVADVGRLPTPRRSRSKPRPGPAKLAASGGSSSIAASSAARAPAAVSPACMPCQADLSLAQVG